MLTRVIYIATLGLAAIANAGCAYDCGHMMVMESDCPKADVECLCKDGKFMERTATCIRSSCSAEEIQRSISDGEKFCAAHNVNATIPMTPATPSLNASESSIAEPTKNAVSQNANGAIMQNVNIVAGIVAFGLVAIALS
ncbi:hypothetical protein AB1N83_011156 [Pleurotus pulmonarius]